MLVMVFLKNGRKLSSIYSLRKATKLSIHEMTWISISDDTSKIMFSSIILIRMNKIFSVSSSLILKPN